MIIFILTLILIAFWQVSFLSFDLIYLILIARSFLRPMDKANYYLGFGLGVLISLLSSQPLGILSLVYLITTRIMSLIRLPFLDSHYISLLLTTFIFLCLNGMLNWKLFDQSINWQGLLEQTVLVIPLYFIIKFWEEGGHIAQKTLRHRLY